MVDEHHSAREKLLSAARQEEEDERLEKLRRLERRRVASCKSSERVDKEEDVYQRKRKRMEEAEELELRTHSSKSWLTGALQQSLVDGAAHLENERETQKRQQIARQIADEEAIFRAERETKKTDTEAMRQSAIIAESRRLQEKAAERASRRPNLLVKNDSEKMTCVSQDVVDATRSAAENGDAADEVAMEETTATMTTNQQHAVASGNLTSSNDPVVNSQSDGCVAAVSSPATSVPAFRKELWPELCGDGEQEKKSSGILGGYDSDSSESGESA